MTVLCCAPYVQSWTVRRHWLQLKQNANDGCNSCTSLAGLVLCFSACCILLVIAPFDVYVGMYSAQMQYPSDAHWSTTRPAVMYVSKMDGSVDVWDFLFRCNKPTLNVTVCTIHHLTTYIYRVVQICGMPSLHTYREARKSGSPIAIDVVL